MWAAIGPRLERPLPNCSARGVRGFDHAARPLELASRCYPRRLRPPRGTMYITASRATTMTTAMATMATVEAARITYVFYRSASALKTQGLRTFPANAVNFAARRARTYSPAPKPRVRPRRRPQTESPADRDLPRPVDCLVFAGVVVGGLGTIPFVRVITIMCDTGFALVLLRQP